MEHTSIAAIIVALFAAGAVITRIRQASAISVSWLYPALLGSFPVFYFLFAIAAGDLASLAKEGLYSLIFYAMVVMAIHSNQRRSLLIVGAGLVLHGLYDFYHDALFTNPGTPAWWPELCATFDLVLGLYLLWSGASQLQFQRPRVISSSDK